MTDSTDSGSSGEKDNSTAARSSCCDGCTEGDETSDEDLDRWIVDSEVLEAELPGDMQHALGRLLADESVETLGEWVTEIRHQTGGGSIAREDLCHAGEETAHWGEIDGERYHFLCFYDAVIMSALAEEPVDIRTESPGGAVIEARASGAGELAVTPGEAVFSFGIDDGVEPPADGKPQASDAYSAVCPYVRAFPDRESYEAWARTVPAATVAMELSGATDVAAALVE